MDVFGVKHTKPYRWACVILGTVSIYIIPNENNCCPYYFFYSGPIFAAKYCDRVCTQSKKLYEDILALLDREK